MKQLPDSVASTDALLKLIDCIPSIALLQVPSTQQVFVNHAFREFTGVEGPSFSKHKLESLIPTADLMVRSEVRKMALQTGEKKALSIGLRDHQGKYHLIHEQMQPIEVGGETMVLSIAMEMPDSTAYSNTNNQLLNDDKWKTLLNSINLGMEIMKSVRNAEGKIVDFRFVLVNEAAGNIISAKKELGEQIIGRGLLELFPSVNGHLFDRYVSVVEEDEVLETDIHHTGEGMDIWLHQKVSKFGDGFLTTFEDISDKKRLEENNIDSLELLESFFDSTAVGVDVLKAVRDEQGELVDFTYLRSNQKALQVHQKFGVPEVQGMSMNRVYPAVKASELFDKLKEVIQTGVTQQDELYFEQGGHSSWFFYNYIKFRDGIVVFHLDITEHKETALGLGKSKDMLQGILDTSSAAIDVLEAVRDEQGEIIDFSYVQTNQLSRKIQRSLGKQYRQGQLLTTVYPKIRKNGLLDRLKKVVTTGQTMQMEVPYNLEGQIRWYLSSYGKYGNDGLILTYVEISQMKMAEGKLKDALHKINLNQQNLIRMVDSVEDFICSVDQELRFTAFNKAYYDEFEKIFGVSIKQGMRMDEAIGHNREAGEQMIVFWQKALLGEQQFIVRDFGNQEKNDYQVQFHPIYGAENQILGVTGFAKNMTRRQKIEEALKDAREFLLLSENLPNVVFTLNSTGELEYLNDAFYRFTGLPKQMYHSAELKKLVHRDDLPRVIALNNVKVAKRVKVDSEIKFRMKHKSGNYRWVLFKLLPILDEDRKLQNWLGSVTDIHEEVMNEETQRKAAEEFRQIADGLPQLVWVTTPDGKATYFNQQWYIYTDTSEHENLNDGWTNQLHPDDIEITLKSWHEAVHNKTGYRVEYRLRNRDGVYRWFLARGIPLLDERGSIEKWFGTCTDIHDQIQQQQQLQNQNKKLNDLNDYLENFVNTVAHDLRSPVANIKGLINLLKDADHEKLKDKAVHKLGASVERLDSTVIGLIQLVEAQHMKGVEWQPVDLKACFQFVRKDYDEELKNLDYDIRLSLGVEKLQFVKPYLESALRNLLSNAIKYRREEVPLRISLQSWQEKGFVVISFSDNGIGIDLDIYGKKLFKPFARFTRKAKGKGVGLHIVNHVFRKEGGKIEVDSTLGEGTAFRLFVPVNA